MRYGILLALGLSTLVVGATCLPIFDLDPPDDPATSTTLAVSIITPAEDREVPAGTVVTIEWTAVNLTESDAIVTVLARHRESSDETILAGGVRPPREPDQATILWDTEGFDGGAYSIIAEISAGEGEDAAEATDTAEGRITINTPPDFKFTDPTEDTTLERPTDPNDPDGALLSSDPNDPNAPLLPARVIISWDASDLDGDGQAEIRLGPLDSYDLDKLSNAAAITHELESAGESASATTILETTIPRLAGSDSIEWDGTTVAGDRVSEGTYYLFAVVWDEFNDERIIPAVIPNGSGAEPPPTEDLVSITVPPEIELAITDPNTDTTFRIDQTQSINYTLNEDNDVFVDLRIDPDENHGNGNETTILGRELIEKGTTDGSFDWDGRDSNGDQVGYDGTGIFQLLMVVDRGSGPTETVEADSVVFLRRWNTQPLITLLEPDADVTLQGGVGGEVLIKWRCDDPSESAKIQLVIDDDATPAQGEVPDDDDDDDAEEEVLPSADWGDLDPGAVGLQNTYRYYVGDDRAPGRYWIFAYIDRNEAASWDDVAIAAGQIVVEDPNEPN